MYTRLSEILSTTDPVEFTLFVALYIRAKKYVDSVIYIEIEEFLQIP